MSNTVPPVPDVPTKPHPLFPPPESAPPRPGEYPENPTIPHPAPEPQSPAPEPGPPPTWSRVAGE